MPRQKGSQEPGSQVAREEEGRASFSGADIGVHFIVCILVGCAFGYAFDRWLGWAPWGMLAGGFVGFAAWLRAVWKMLQRV